MSFFSFFSLLRVVKQFLLSSCLQQHNVYPLKPPRANLALRSCTWKKKRIVGWRGWLRDNRFPGIRLPPRLRKEKGNWGFELELSPGGGGTFIFSLFRKEDLSAGIGGLISSFSSHFFLYLFWEVPQCPSARKLAVFRRFEIQPFKFFFEQNRN